MNKLAVVGHWEKEKVCSPSLLPLLLFFDYIIPSKTLFTGMSV